MDRLGKLKALEERLCESMEIADEKTLPAIAKQYRETIREIEEIEGTEADDDEIGDILQCRQANGEPGAVRKDRAKLHQN